MRVLAILAGLLAGACGHGSVDRSAAPSGSGGCEVSAVRLTLTTRPEPGSGEIGGMVVPVDRHGAPGWLAIDTGSALTFLYLGRDGERYVPVAGEVRLGCETLELPGRNLAADDEISTDAEDPGLREITPIVGVLGASFFIGAVTDFDPANRSITRYHRGMPQGIAGWGSIPYEDIEGHIIIRLIADGRPRRLMWDTGSPHMLLIGETGRPGDEESRAMDIEGGTFAIFTGTSRVEIGDGPSRVIPVLRAPRFPYFEGTNEALGGGIDGLAGQSVFGTRRMVFDPGHHLIYVEPALPSAR